MRPVSIALNYAEALFSLGETSGRSEEYAGLLEAIASAVDGSPKAQAVLMSPKVTKTRKAEILAAALPGAPREFVLFLTAVVKRGRQLLLGEMAAAYRGLLDVKFNRVRAGITLARTPDPAMQAGITEALEKALGKEVLASFAVDPDLLGGAIIRVGDRVLDGSVRRKLAQLKRQLLAK
ncbi:MAG TPA: ATP synthase F1 subunit delta [Gemmatimonadales bacterium]|nr:ATP synthase F1 subunit delta [Gemmatimonadales bacterium]